MPSPSSSTRVILSLLPFWLFTILFKTSAALHYTLIPVLGERVTSVWLIGIIIGVAALLQLVLDVPAGFLLDRFGYVRTLKISTTCFLVGVLSLMAGIHVWNVLFSVFAGVFGWLFYGPGVDAYVLSKAEPRLAGRFMAVRDIMTSAGVVLGMAILPFVVQAGGQLLAIVLAIPFMLSLIALSRAKKDNTSVHASKKIGHQSYYIRRNFVHHVLQALGKLNPVSTILMLQRFSAAVFYGIVWFVVPLMLAQMSTAGALSFGLTIFDLAVLVTGFFIGRLADKWHKRVLIFWGMLLFSVSALLLGFHFGILFLVLGFMATTGDEMASVSLWAWLDHLDKEHAEDGLVTGALNLAEDLGWTVGPVIAGFLFLPVGPTWTIVAGALLIFFAWIIASLLMRHTLVPAEFPESKNDIPRHKPHKH